MQLLRPTPEQGELGLRALWTLAALDGPPGPEERSVLAAGQTLSGASTALDALAPIEPAVFAAAFAPDPQLRWQLVCALVLMSMIDGTPSVEETALVRAYADALDIENDMLETAIKLSAGRLRLARLDIYRRFWGREHIMAKIRSEGFSGLRETLRALRRKHQNSELTARYRALAKLAPGTLGRGYYEFITANEFSFPGELGHGPEIIAQHDLAHVLGGYGSSSREELGVAFFSAGFRREDPMTFVLLGLFQLHIGIATMPGQPVDEGALDMSLCLEALQRGAAMSVDLSGKWDYWAVIDEPVDTLRQRYAIPPRTTS